MKNISQKDAHDLLERSENFVFWILSCGMKDRDVYNFKYFLGTIRHNLRINPQRSKNIMRCKTYAPDWTKPWIRWKIIDRTKCKSTIVLLCKNNNNGYAVFTDLLSDRSYPSDKFFGTFKGAYACYKGEVKSENKDY